MTDVRANSPGRSIVLIGFRGSGKSSVGRGLVELVGGDCVDTDDAIMAQSGRSVSDIFAEEGEAGFRRRERDAIAQIARECPKVVSVGGGAVLDAGNVDLLRRVGIVVWLTAPAGVLWHRICTDPETSGTRPALTGLSGLSEVEHLQAERDPYYRAAADIVVDTSGSDPIGIAAEVARRCGNVQGPG